RCPWHGLSCGERRAAHAKASRPPSGRGSSWSRPVTCTRRFVRFAARCGCRSTSRPCAKTPPVITIDSSSFIAYLDGSTGPEVEATDLALAHRQAALPPAVLTELLSEPPLSGRLRQRLVGRPRLSVVGGYRVRQGLP